MSQHLVLAPVQVDVVLGTRPEAIKLAPVITAIRQSRFAVPRVVSTGQHPELVREILGYFGEQPDVDLGLMSRGQSLNDLLSRAVASLGAHLRAVRPDLVVVQGDTTSALAGALAAFHEGVPVAHVEAGLRSGSLARPFPEEANRVLIGRLANLHFAPTAGAARNLLDEGADPSGVHVYGNTVIDALRLLKASGVRSSLEEFEIPAGSRLILVTAHRRENWGERFATICRAVRDLVDRHRDAYAVFVTHPNPDLRAVAGGLLGGHPRVRLAPPLPYASFVQLLDACEFALSDSGGVQEEATTLGKPVLLLRSRTERPEGVDAGTVRLVGTDRNRIVEAADTLLNDWEAYARSARATDCFGDGRASERIATCIGHFFGRAELPAPYATRGSQAVWPDAARGMRVGLDESFTVPSS